MGKRSRSAIISHCNNNYNLKTLIVKVIGCGLLFVGSNTKVTARPFTSYNDTSKAITGIPVIKDDPVIIIKKANVVYPALFTGNEEQTISYIEKFSSARRNYLINTFNRSKKLFPKAAKILKKYNVPQEFRVLLALESGFNPNAVSSAGAVGYWQIMDVVAKEYGMKIAAKTTVKIKKGKKKKGIKKEELVVVYGNTPDDRKNFEKSTHVAARYLRDRYRNLNGDWLLIAASYNCGVGNVWNAMDRCGKKSPTFWDIKDYLPAETRAYVMNFITLNVIFNNYEAFTANDLCFRDVVDCLPEMEEEDCEEDIAYNTANDY